MHLTKEQERILNGEYGWAKARALQVIVKVGEALGAEKLVRIVHAHVSGVSYNNIGEPGLRFLQEFLEKGAKTAVYSTINPGCIDLMNNSEIIDQTLYHNQLKINNALENMGFSPTYTCIPYYHRPPAPKEHLAWGESNAVIIANSLFGAKTNREGGPIALAAAITGYTYYSGLHLDENRIAKKRIIIPKEISEKEYSAIGLWIGYNIYDIPVIEFNREKPSIYELKLLLSSAAASGKHGLIAIKDVTPRETYSHDIDETIELEQGDYIDLIGTPPSIEESILGYIGCPHLHPCEFVRIYQIATRYRRVRNNNGLLISIPPFFYELFRQEINDLRTKGIDIAFGTCPIVSKLTKQYDYLVTNSGKSCFYMSRIHHINTYIASVREIIDLVMEK